ncbi:MAG: ribonuclease III [Opitutae bacterium]|nr:ribonuclease III [Opitutae bacterium]
MAESEQAPELGALEERLGHVFRRPGLLAAALTHRSHAAETNPPDGMENQRLEFLGDAILGAISAEWLVAHRSDWREGTLTKVRSRLTNAAALARVARRLGLGDFLRLGRGEDQGGGREKGALLADALEAVMGALWLDGGPGPVRQVFEKEFADEIAEAVEAGGDDNPKGDLQERLQRAGKDGPRYERVAESGPPHARHFTVAVFRGEERLGEGGGASKREAEMNAARQALERLDASAG